MEENGRNLQPVALPDAPRAMFRVTVDDKGRLKLPALIAQYLVELGERKLFITTLDELEARIYPLSVWRQTERALQEPGPDSADRKDLALVAAHYGMDVEMDAQGRVTLPAELRKLLGLEGDEVGLQCFKGRINILNSAELARRLGSARTNLLAKNQALESKGL